MAYESSNYTPIDVKSYGKIDGGMSGAGGLGGYGYSNSYCSSTSIIISGDPCKVTNCTGAPYTSPPPCNDTWVCDHKRAICMLANVTYGAKYPVGSSTPTRVNLCSNPLPTGSNLHPNCDQTTSTDYIGYFDIALQRLVDVELKPATPTCSTAHYMYYTFLQDGWISSPPPSITICEGMMEGISRLIACFDLTLIDHNQISTTGCTTNPLIIFNTDRNMHAYKYDETKQYLMDIQTSNQSKCNIAGCDDDNLLNSPGGGAGVTAPRGHSGAIGSSYNGGVFTYGGPSLPPISPGADFVSDEMTPLWKKDPTGITNTINSKIKIEVFPNPAKDAVSLNIFTPTNTKCEIKFYDMLGKQVLQYEFNLTSGLNEKIIDVHLLIKGNYSVEFKTSEGNYYSKVTIE